jgi:hypothetical protein
MRTTTINLTNLENREEEKVPKPRKTVFVPMPPDKFKAEVENLVQFITQDYETLTPKEQEVVFKAKVEILKILVERLGI